MDTIASYLRTLNDRKRLLAQLQDQFYDCQVDKSLADLSKVINDIQLIENDIKLNSYDTQTLQMRALDAANIFNQYTATLSRGNECSTEQLVQNLSTTIRALSTENYQLKQQLQETQQQTSRDLQQYCD